MAFNVPANLSGIRILVLDDDETLRLLSQRVLAAAGGAVETAEDGREGLQILLRQDFDVVVVDLRMKEMDGITFIQEARNIWPWLGFIIVTGFADDVASAQAAALGVTRFLEKPVSPARLQTSVLEEAHARRTQTGTSPAGFEQQHQHQLRILGQLGEAALASGTLVEALRELSDGLGALLSCDVAGLFGRSADQEVIVLSVQKPVTQSFLDRAGDEMISRYSALTGRRLKRGDLRIQIEGGAPDPAGAPEPGRMLTVPILAAKDVQGMLLLASASPDSFRSTDVSFLYHVANLLSAILAAVNRVRQMAVRDALTGLYNRAFLEEELERAWLLARRHGHHMAVAILDLDRFKTLNDTHGHLVGDQVLREFADVIKRVARTSDIVARYGGDEFVVVLPQTDLPSGLSLGTRVLTAVGENVFCEDSLRLHLTASVGIASSRDIEPTARAAEMLRLADTALYAAKRDGRNRVRVWIDPAAEGGRSPSAQAALTATATTPSRGNILIVDDDPRIGGTLKDVLAGQGYSVVTEMSPIEALKRVQDRPGGFDIAITDLSMPEVSGLHLLDALQQADPLVMRVVLTGYATKENAIASLRHGAFEFIEKPIIPDELLAIMEKALEHRRLRMENERYRMRLEDMVREKSAALVGALDQVKAAHNFTLQALADLLDAREHATGQHSVRVRETAVVLGRAMHLAPHDLDTLAHGALLHDIGKIAVPDAILLKTTPLTDKEWRVMKTHPDVGYNILRSSAHLDHVAELVRSHQERFDGTGYPRGLRGEAICLGARIFAVVDAYDAMRSRRAYRQAMPPRLAIDEIRRGSGTQFDPVVVESFLRSQPELEKIGKWPPA